MERATDHALAEGKRLTRNPYMVLGVAPIFEHTLQEEIESLDKHSAEKVADPDVRVLAEYCDADDTCDDHPFIRKCAKGIQSFATPPEGADAAERSRRARRVELLKQQRERFKRYLFFRSGRTLAEHKRREMLSAAWEHRSVLTELQQRALPSFPAPVEVPPVREGVPPAQLIPTPDECHATVARLAEALESALAQMKRRSPNRRPLTEAQAAVTRALRDSAALSKAIRKGNELCRCLTEALRLTQKILDADDAIGDRYKELQWQYSPDLHPEDPEAAMRCKEVHEAYRALLHADADGRRALARDLVFGQDTGFWTPEMRQAADSITESIAGIFALQLSPRLSGSDPCPACAGRGSIPAQGPRDYFPVPRVCEECRGEGVISEAVTELRKALAQVVRMDEARPAKGNMRKKNEMRRRKR